jgi:ABC-type uncharacterized transport system substrate-binding protein
MVFSFRSILLICAVLILPLRAEAHPHIWIDYRVEVIGGADGNMEWLRFHWTFDEMFSSMMAGDILGLKGKAAGTAELTKAQIDKLRDKAFANLKNYHYYIYMIAGGEAFEPQEAEDFSASLKGGKLSYDFTVKLPRPVRKIEFSLYDPEFYVDIGPPVEKETPKEIPEGGSFMRTEKVRLADFVSVSAAKGINPPACTHMPGAPMASTWGVFMPEQVICLTK